MEVRDMGLIVDRGVGGAQSHWLNSVAELAAAIRVFSNVADTAALVSAVAGAANDAYLAIVVPGVNVTVLTAWWYNGAAVAGNVDAGVYGLDGKLLGSTGAVAQAGTTAIQSAALTTPVRLLAGRPYYLALSTSSATAQFQGLDSGSVVNARVLGFTRVASAHPLPGALTPAAMQIKQLFVFGVTSRTGTL